MSIGLPIPEIEHFQNLTLKIQGQGQRTMMLHKYRPRQFHPVVSEKWVPQSLAQVLPDFTSFWPMGKPIWGKSANNYDVAQLQVHETLNGVNPSSSFRDMRSAKSGPNLWQI